LPGVARRSAAAAGRGSGGRRALDPVEPEMARLPGVHVDALEQRRVPLHDHAGHVDHPLAFAAVGGPE
jgi:hypothetical protein